MWWVGPLTVFSAVIGVLIVRAIAMAILPPPYGPGLEMIMIPIVLTVVFCTGGVIVFALVGRFAKNPVRTFITISIVFLFVSFIPDLLVPTMGVSMPGVTWGYAITLMIMHVVAGFITVFMLIKLTTTKVDRRERIQSNGLS